MYIKENLKTLNIRAWRNSFEQKYKKGKYNNKNKP